MDIMWENIKQIAEEKYDFIMSAGKSISLE